MPLFTYAAHTVCKLASSTSPILEQVYCLKTPREKETEPYAVSAGAAETS